MFVNVNAHVKPESYYVLLHNLKRFFPPIKWNTLFIFVSIINQLDAQNFGFTISLLHASTCFGHMCSKQIEAWNKLIVKQKFCASSLVNYWHKYTEMHGQQNVKKNHAVHSLQTSDYYINQTVFYLQHSLVNKSLDL